MLPETVRKQYLDAMGIQVWYDPEYKPQQAIAEPLEAAAIASQSIEAQATSVVSQSADVTIQSKAETNTQVDAQAPVTPAHKIEQQTDSVSITQLQQNINECTLCELHASRQTALPGEGFAQASLMVISLAPFSEEGEDVLLLQAEREMLQAMLVAIGQSLDKVYLTSLVKCRPPEKRLPYTSEMICCDDHLSAQINLIQPSAILLLGEQVSQQLLVSQKSLMDLRCRRHQHLGVPVFASCHPVDIINSTENKRKVWQDLLQIKKQLKTHVTP